MIKCDWHTGAIYVCQNNSKQECYFSSLHSDGWCCTCKYHSETFVRRCSDHDQWTWLRERKLQKQEDSEGEVSCLSETEWYFYCSSGCKWIREVIKGLQFILCIPLWEWSDLHINKAKVVESKMWRRVLATVNYLFHLSCVWLFFANIDGAGVSITFYHWF